jgi:hypothetical protein
MTKKQILKSAIFMLLFLFMLRSVSYIVRTNGDTKNRFCDFYSERKDSIDAFIVGSSPVYPYYSAPKMFGEYGFTCFPLSSSMQRPLAVKYVLKEAYKTQKPGLVIIEMRMFTGKDSDMTANTAYTRGVTDNMKYSLNRIDTINAIVPVIKDRSVVDPMLTYYIDIFKYHSNWGMMLMPSEWRHWDYCANDPLKGYVFQDKLGPCTRQDCRGITESEPIPEEQEKALRDLIVFLKARGQDTLFIVSPYLETADNKKMYNYMASIIDGSGFRMIDMNDDVDSIGLDYSTEIADYGVHVNALGAVKCTDYLAKYIKSNYDMPDHRNDPKYSKWEDSYQTWKTEQAKEVKIIESRIKNHDYNDLKDKD